MKVIWDSLRRDAWTAAVGGAPLQQHWAYGAVAARMGAQVRRAQVRAPNGQLGYVQCILRRFGPLRVAWHGVQTPWGGVVAGSLRFEGPLIWLSPGGGGANVGAGCDSAVVDLARPNLRAALHGKWRNRLCAAERLGTPVFEISGLPDWLIATEKVQQKQARYRNFPQAWMMSWARYAPGSICTLTAGPQDAPIAASAFLMHGQSATYLMGWTGDEGRSVSAHNLLIWHAMSRFSKAGLLSLDLGGIGPSTPGLNRFKMGTGATLRQTPSLKARYISKSTTIRDPALA